MADLLRRGGSRTATSAAIPSKKAPFCVSSRTATSVAIPSKKSPFCVSSRTATSAAVPSKKAPFCVIAKIRKPLEERYSIRFERNITQEKLQELSVESWSRWESWGKCKLRWEWHVDQIVYILHGSVKVVPEGAEDEAWFYAGDLVRYPKWLQASLYFQGPYAEKYRFLAYGDTDLF
eukprot:TRINITY_DN4186_c0_g1_i1.p1 TRINITY_DN4186_c0_g1~~TRINITY_DN4186_c0_g1_i1.p1  ORF type:complete len:197 (+),score=6.51 TRINITY_DN4186_c0_g1_i1:62-592(+)